MKILKSIGMFLLALLIFYGVYALCAFLLLLIAEIPIIGRIFFHSDEQPTHWVPIMMSAVAAYMASTASINGILRDHSEKVLSKRILGVVLAVFNILFLIINLIGKASIFLNLAFVVAGFVFIFNAPNDD